MKYLFSYQYYNGQSGNKTGTLADVKHFATEHKVHWKSYQFFEILPSDGPLAELKFIDVVI